MRGADEAVGVPLPSARAQGGATAARRPRFGWHWQIVVLAAVLALLTLYPVAMLLYGSLHSTPPGEAGGFTLEGYRQLASPETLGVLGNTLAIALVKTVLSLSLATLLAWIIARTDTPGRAVLEVLITLPFFIPPVLTAMAWGMLGNPQVGTINLVWKFLTGTKTSPINVYSWFGIVWHMMQYSTVFSFMFIVNGFRAMDPSLEDAARMAGAPPLATFRRVTFFLMLPAVTACFVLSFIRGIESFESPLFFGLPAHINLVTTQIYNSIEQSATPRYQYATALSFAILALMFVLVMAQRRVLGGRSYETVTGKGYAPRLIQLGRWRYATFAFCALFFAVTVVLPVGQLLVGSFFKFMGFYSWRGLTLDHYREVAVNGDFWRAFANTMGLGLVGASLTMVLGALVAYVTVRTRWRGRSLVDSLAWLPWMMPGIVLGLGFLWAYAFLPASIPIYGTIWALLLAYIALGTPVSVRVMSASFAQLSADLEDCARIHGASFWQTLWRILVALSWPAFAVGWVLTFFGIMRELSASILLYSVGSEVLSIVLLKLWINGQAGQVSVIGLLMMLLVIFFRWVQLRMMRGLPGPV
jgi:iron(III) transport system permease protein